MHIENAEFNVCDVDGSAPDWYTSPPFLDFWFEMEGSSFGFRIEWPTQEQISEVVASGAAPDARAKLRSPRFQFSMTFENVKALLAIQPVLTEIVESCPSEPHACGRILKKYGFWNCSLVDV